MKHQMAHNNRINMDLEIQKPAAISSTNNSDECKTHEQDSTLQEILSYLSQNPKISFKCQHKDEDELGPTKKLEIAQTVFNNSKSNFLFRFGKYFKPEHLEYFKQTCDKNDYELNYHIEHLSRFLCRDTRNKDIRNRRYEALKQMCADTRYFSETEMMKRNPLLYEHLVGQYLTEEQRKERDSEFIEAEKTSFVNILLEGIDRENVQQLKHDQEDAETEVTEETEDTDEEEAEENLKMIVDDKLNNKITMQTKWGEWDNKADRRKDEISNSHNSVKRERNWFLISDREKQLLKDEFISLMYEQFLDGKDQDFDYSMVDFNTSYDNTDMKNQDEEDKYFDSESPQDMEENNQSNKVVDTMEATDDASEDELDVYMKRLIQNPTVSQLSNEIEKL